MTSGRTTFVVSGMALLFALSWIISLGRLFGVHFWDQQYATQYLKDHPVDGLLGGDSTAMNDVSITYFTNRRYIFLLPHVLGAVFWWNLYFLQLIPSFRQKHLKLHRLMGRFLMVIALMQTCSGFGMAMTSHSHVILMVSFGLTVASFFCVYQSWWYAYHRDIVKHKYWSYRLVGYMQAIALQRFFMIILIIGYEMGVYPVISNPSENPDHNTVLLQLFDDSFILALLSAMLVTEWYLAGESGMLEKGNGEESKLSVSGTNAKQAIASSNQQTEPLLKTKERN